MKGAWITARELGTHLEYTNPRIAVRNLYDRSKDHFKKGVHFDRVAMDLSGRTCSDVLIFSEKGALKVISLSVQKAALRIMDEVFDVYLDYKKELLSQPDQIDFKRLDTAVSTPLP